MPPFPFLQHCSSRPVVLIQGGINAGHSGHVGTRFSPGRSEPYALVVFLTCKFSSPCHATDTILRPCCAPCVVLPASQCGPVYVSALAHFLQAVRRYASAPPTAAFAGQKGSNVRLCTSSHDLTSSRLAARVNIPLHSFREMVRQSGYG